MFTVEELHPSSDRIRHAQLLAAIHNGALTRREKKLFSASDFLNPRPWELSAPAKDKRSLQQQIDSLNARIDP